MYSSVQSQPCFFIPRMSSITYVCRSPFTARSLMFKINEPLGCNTLLSSREIGRNQSTYFLIGTPPYVDFLLSAYGGEVTMRLIVPLGIVLSISAQSPKVDFIQF